MKKTNLKPLLKELAEISNWFENQQELDVEDGLVKIKKAALLIKQSKDRLKKIENEFEEIKKDIETEIE